MCSVDRWLQVEVWYNKLVFVASHAIINMKFCGLRSSYLPVPSFPPLWPAHTGRVWEPNYLWDSFTSHHKTNNLLDTGQVLLCQLDEDALIARSSFCMKHTMSTANTFNKP